MIVPAQTEGVFAHRLNVLLVEDSPRLVERLTEVLHEIPAVALTGTAGTEEEAVTFARREAVDVIILDLHLREGTGFGVIRALAAVHRESLYSRITTCQNTKMRRRA